MPYPIEQAPWERSLKPIYDAFDGIPHMVDIDDLWDPDDEETKWREAFGSYGGSTTTLGGLTPQQTESQIVLPKTTNRGDHEADIRAAQRGINPSRSSGGTGNVIDLARSQLGTPYVWGAEGPNGFDCSGLIYWAFNRAGINIPRQTAEGYQSIFQPVSRDELQPGDVIFYNYGRKGAGAADHIEIFMGDGRQIGTSNVREDLDIDPVDWDNVIGYGRAPGAGGINIDAPIPGQGTDVRKPRLKSTPIMNETSTVPSALAGGAPDFTSVIASTMAPDAMRTKMVAPQQATGGDVKSQLVAGFRDAGRQDLARMVNTKAFQTWIQQESGWRVDVTSPANNHGKANDGLFQIWRGHDYNSSGQVAQMSAYEQAQLVAKYFSHLTPAKIREYAKQISNGSYHGWG
jgi:cell wall-associated NlpC family hydrolase